MSYCGDGKIQSLNGSGIAELCDDGINGSDTCYGPNTAPLGQQACTATSCGDGVIQATEQCDDANNNAFDGCSNCVSILCEINGYIYLDTQDNNYYDRSTDITQSSLYVQLTDTNQTWGMMTDTNGYYSFTGLDCAKNYRVSYINTTNYIADSSQSEDINNLTTPQELYVVSTLFQDTTPYISPNNNFGLKLYDLYIDKSVNTTTVTMGSIVTYRLDFGNHGPSTASGAILRDIFNPNELMPLKDTLQLSNLSGIVTVTWTTGVLEIDKIPVLASGDRFTLSFQARVLTNPNSSIINNANIFV